MVSLATEMLHVAVDMNGEQINEEKGDGDGSEHDQM